MQFVLSQMGTFEHPFSKYMSVTMIFLLINSPRIPYHFNTNWCWYLISTLIKFWQRKAKHFGKRFNKLNNLRSATDHFRQDGRHDSLPPSWNSEGWCRSPSQDSLRTPTGRSPACCRGRRAFRWWRRIRPASFPGWGARSGGRGIAGSSVISLKV